MQCCLLLLTSGGATACDVQLAARVQEGTAFQLLLCHCDTACSAAQATLSLAVVQGVQHAAYLY